MITDIVGNEIKLGSRIVYAMGYRQDYNLYTGTVIGTEETEEEMDDIVELRSDKTGMKLFRASKDLVVF